MILENDTLIRIIILFLGICGFLVARNIRRHKTKNTPLICPGKFDCHTVVHSDYSKFLGLPVELCGMIYYAFTTLVYIFLIFFPEFLSITVISFLFSASLAAFLFSLYLVVIQIFILKKGCSWCFISALISISIFILTIFTYDIIPMVQSFIN